mmetsp:Transcript_8334/g.11532  ORF Transcript_8334/g.11532 Transcript_8334/m.11532 type:complete len:107 (+) Transcript_8334:460-780(+)
MSVKKWIEEVREHAEPEIVIMLVGNKLDLAESVPSERKVAREFAADFARKNKLLFMETSAMADVNVRDVFEYLVQEIYTVQNSQNLSSMRNQTRGKKLTHSDPNLG